IERRLAELALHARAVELAEALADVLAQLLHVLEAGVHGEVVVELRQLLRLDLLDGDLERGVAAGELLVRVVGGERHRDVAPLTAARPDQPLLEAGNQVAGAQLEQLVAPLCPREGAQVRLLLRARLDQRARVVHHHEVTLGGGTLGGLQARQALAHGGDLLVDLLVRHGGLAASDLEALVLAELGAREHPDLDRELERVPLWGELGEAQLRIAHGHDPGGHDRRRVPAGEAVAHRLLEHRLAAHPLKHERRRHLSAPEARKLHLAPELRRLALQALLDLPAGISTCTRTRESPSSVTVVFTAVGTSATIPCRRMGDGGARRRLRRLEASLWTGRAAHLIGGSLDFAEALARYSLRRLRSRRSRSPNGRRA